MTSISTSPRTVEEIFRDYTGRRSALLRALTLDVDDFYSQCNPEKENLCLYGHANESWEVTLPAEEVPPELPEPALGINFARDGMQRKDWLSLRSQEGHAKTNSKLLEESYGDDEDEHGETVCGSCGGTYSADEFWIGCDICERWYHGKCVKITPAKADSIKHYKCPSCCTKKARQ
ncbi:PHD finger protein ALFIN-LIKE 1 [Linum grandiflorum]